MSNAPAPLDPNLTSAQLAAIATQHPQSHRQVAEHPVAYRQLLQWLVEHSPDPLARTRAQQRLEVLRRRRSWQIAGSILLAVLVIAISALALRMQTRAPEGAVPLTTEQNERGDGAAGGQEPQGSTGLGAAEQPIMLYELDASKPPIKLADFEPDTAGRPDTYLGETDPLSNHLIYNSRIYQIVDNRLQENTTAIGDAAAALSVPAGRCYPHRVFNANLSVRCGEHDYRTASVNLESGKVDVFDQGETGFRLDDDLILVAAVANEDSTFVRLSDGNGTVRWQKEGVSGDDYRKITRLFLRDGIVEEQLIRELFTRFQLSHLAYWPGEGLLEWKYDSRSPVQLTDTALNTVLSAEDGYWAVPSVLASPAAASSIIGYDDMRTALEQAEPGVEPPSQILPHGEVVTLEERIPPNVFRWRVSSPWSQEDLQWCEVLYFVNDGDMALCQPRWRVPDGEDYPTAPVSAMRAGKSELVWDVTALLGDLRRVGQRHWVMTTAAGLYLFEPPTVGAQ